MTEELRKCIRQIIIEAQHHFHIQALTRALKDDDCDGAKRAFNDILKTIPVGYRVENELRLTKSDYRKLVNSMKECDLDVPRSILGVGKNDVPEEKKSVGKRSKPKFDSREIARDVKQAYDNVTSFKKEVDNNTSFGKSMSQLYTFTAEYPMTDIKEKTVATMWTQLLEFSDWKIKSGSDDQGYYKAIYDYLHKDINESYGDLQSVIQEIIRKVGDEYVLYSRKKNPKTGKRRRLGRSGSLEGIKKREKQVQYFKHAG